MTKGVKFVFFFICVIIYFATPQDTWAASKARSVKEGNKLFQKGDFGSSIEKYEAALKNDPESDVINFDLGTAYYKKGDYQDAIEHLQKALLSDDSQLRAKALYNIGNSYYKLGKKFEDQNPELATDFLKKAQEAYHKSLELNPKDKDSQNNLKQAKKELKKIEKLAKKKKKLALPGDGKDSNTIKEEGNVKNNILTPSGEAKNKEGVKIDKEENLVPWEKSENKDANSGKKIMEEAEKVKDKVYNKELTPQEAKMLLENYQQTEEPKGLLKIYRPSEARQEGEYKDW